MNPLNFESKNKNPIKVLGKPYMSHCKECEPESVTFG